MVQNKTVIALALTSVFVFLAAVGLFSRVALLRLHGSGWTYEKMQKKKIYSKSAQLRMSLAVAQAFESSVAQTIVSGGLAHATRCSSALKGVEMGRLSVHLIPRRRG